MQIWEGIYPSFDAAGGNTGTWCESLWVDRSKEKALRILGGASSSCDYCIPSIAAFVQAKKQHIRILEFGGSVGLSVRAIVEALADRDAVEIHIIDNENVCAAGREVFKCDPRVFFHTRIPDGMRFDLAHCGSSIQYVENWSEVVRQLVRSAPDFLVFDDVPAGDIPTFVSLQAYYGKTIPHWFFNLGEFIDTVESVTGYQLRYEARYVGTFLGKHGPFPMQNFPEDHRIENAHNLAFARPAG